MMARGCRFPIISLLPDPSKRHTVAQSAQENNMWVSVCVPEDKTRRLQEERQGRLGLHKAPQAKEDNQLAESLLELYCPPLDVTPPHLINKVGSGKWGELNPDPDGFQLSMCPFVMMTIEILHHDLL